MTTTEAPKRQLWELQSMQAAPLSVKIALTKDRIREWVNQYGEDGVYVSFSGGKDFTVLLTIAREMYPDIKAVFVDTGLEYPEIREYVRTWDNVDWLKPKLTFKHVIEKYGYPFVSKEVSGKIDEARKKPGGYAWRALHGSKQGTRFDISKWAYLINAPFKMHSYCCNAMKKNPAKAYEKLTHRVPITAQMACESKVRKSQWLKYGCNAFTKKRKISNPMSFWTEQDVLQYIKLHQIPIASVYGDIVNEDEDGMTYDFMFCEMPLKTTGCQRTGCMFCGFGCHLEKPGEGRFERMKVTHPKQYEYIMKPCADGGLGYKQIIDWLNEHGNLNIRY